VRDSIEKALVADVKVTVSGGIASAREGEDSGLLLSRADKALYTAKELGRNCICVDDGAQVTQLEQGEFADTLVNVG
jgi:GGDEF domain-containing protein